VPLYRDPTVPFGRDVVRSTSFAGLIVKLSFAVAVCCGLELSVTVSVTAAEPTALCAGVPAIAPLDAAIPSAEGNPLAA
jgi:hypothetical protein